MEEKKEKSIARSLEAKPPLLKYLPDLLKDLWALGCSPDVVIELLKPLDLVPEKTSVLDLGCGKGAVLITLAKEFGFNAVGVDASEVFLNEARNKASEIGVENKCRFELEDIRDFVKQSHQYDVVVYASLGNILGNFKEIVGHLRNQVCKGGYIIIDDGYLKDTENVDRVGYEHYLAHDRTIEQLLSHGDKLVREVISEEETKAINLVYLEAIKSRAKKVIEQNPHIRMDIEEYINNQEAECRFIETYISGAIWLLQKM